MGVCRLLATVAVLLLAGCAFPAARPARTVASTTIPGELTIDLRTDTPWPYRLERIVVAVDGEVLWRRSGHKPRTDETLARVRVQPHVAHVLAVMVDAVAPCGLAGDEDRRLRIRSTTVFAVD